MKYLFLLNLAHSVNRMSRPVAVSGKKKHAEFISDLLCLSKLI